MADDYARVHLPVNAIVHWTRRSHPPEYARMDNPLIRNVRYLMGDMKQEPYAKLVGVNQSSISRLLRGEVAPSIDTVRAIARHHGYSIDALVEADLTVPYQPPVPSQPVQLDLDTLGHALTAFDKALREKKLRGNMGKARKTFAAAYKMAGYFSNLFDPAQRAEYDAMVARELTGELDGQGATGVAEGGKEGNRGAATQTPKNRRRAG